MTRKPFVLVSRPCFDNDPPAGDPPAGDPPAGDAKFTPEQQAKVDAIVAKERRTWQDKAKGAATTIEELTTKVTQTEEQKAATATQLSTLKSEYTTKAERDQAAHQEQVQALTSSEAAAKTEAGDWRDRYATSTAKTEIVTAATRAEAFNPLLVDSILGPRAELVQKHDADGRPVNGWEVKIPMMKTKDDGSIVEVKVTPEEAVKMMVADPEQYGSLFKSTATGGLGKAGGSGKGGGGTFDPYNEAGQTMARDNPEEYRRKSLEHDKAQSGVA